MQAYPFWPSQDDDGIVVLSKSSGSGVRTALSLVSECGGGIEARGAGRHA